MTNPDVVLFPKKETRECVKALRKSQRLAIISLGNILALAQEDAVEPEDA